MNRLSCPGIPIGVVLFLSKMKGCAKVQLESLLWNIIMLVKHNLLLIAQVP